MAYSGAYAKTPNSQTMTWQPGKEPDQIRYFELDFDTKGNGVSLTLLQSGWDSVAGWADVPAKLAPVVSSGKFKNSGKPYLDKTPGPGGRKPLGISLAAPMPLPTGNSPYPEAGKCLYVIQLASGAGSSGTDWRFSRSFAPFSLGDREYSASGAQPVQLKELFSHASLITPDGKGLVHPDPQEVGAETYPQTRWACFLFDFATAKAEIGSSFALRYNTHVEIRDNESGEFIPLMIDPDIGIPGGGYPPGGGG